MRLLLLADTHLSPRAEAFNRNLDAAMAFAVHARPDAAIHLGDVTADAARPCTTGCGLCGRRRPPDGVVASRITPPGATHEDLFRHAAVYPQVARWAAGPPRDAGAVAEAAPGPL